MMAEYIEREALLEKLQTVEKAVFKNGYYNGQLHFEAVSGKDIVSAPAADVVPVVHGRWRKSRIPVPVYGGIEISCSSCGRIAAHEYNYCPNCGAKMDGE